MYSWNTLVKQATEKKYQFWGTVIEQKITESGFFRLTVQCSLPKKFTGKSIFIYIKETEKEASFEPGTTISTYGKLCVSASSEFNDYLIKEKIIGTLFTKSKFINHLQDKNLTGSVTRIKNQIRLTATKAMSQQTKQLFELLFLGYKGESKLTSVDLQFKAWGISHFLARSGLHLNFFIALTNAVLIYIPLGWQLKQLIIFLIVFFYCFLTWTTISIMRTFGLFALIKLFLYTKNHYDPFNAICFIWMVLLILNPFYLFFLDFQLTFILSGALIWLSKEGKRS